MSKSIESGSVSSCVIGADVMKHGVRSKDHQDRNRSKGKEIHSKGLAHVDHGIVVWLGQGLARCTRSAASGDSLSLA